MSEIGGHCQKQWGSLHVISFLYKLYYYIEHGKIDILLWIVKVDELHLNIYCI